MKLSKEVLGVIVGLLSLAAYITIWVAIDGIATRGEQIFFSVVIGLMLIILVINNYLPKGGDSQQS